MDLGKKLLVFGKIKIWLVEECSVLWRDIRVLAFSKKKSIKSARHRSCSKDVNEFYFHCRFSYRLESVLFRAALPRYAELMAE